MKRPGVEDAEMLDDTFVQAPTRRKPSSFAFNSSSSSSSSSFSATAASSVLRQQMNWTMICSTSDSTDQTLVGSNRVLLAVIDVDTLAVLSLSVCDVGVSYLQSV